MTTTYLRAYLEKRNQEKSKVFLECVPEENDYLFVFDTETTIDLLQNLKVGYFMAFYKEVMIDNGYFYIPQHCTNKELKIMKEFCSKQNVKLIEHGRFIEIFYDYVLAKKALCIGFNLLFDFSRIAIDCSFTKGKRFHNGFSFTLTDKAQYPRLKIRANGKENALIEFGTSLRNPYFSHTRGRFLDLHTLSLALSGQKSISLEDAGKFFKAKDIKKKIESHGTISVPYLKYLANDVLCTYSLYLALIEELKKYNLPTNPEKVFSSASIGKGILNEIGLKNFQNQNQNFPKNVSGYCMSSYYGGRSEVRIRKTSTKISLLDFTSMYPTVNILTKMDKLLTAETIEILENTSEVQEFLDNVSIEDTQKSEFWSKLPAIVLVKPDEYSLPSRMNFNSDEEAKNIGICKVSSDVGLWVTLADIVAHKLETNNSPKIIKALSFVPRGTQKGLKKIKVLDIDIDLRDLSVKLVNERNRVKKIDESKDKAIKIVLNSISYGIYIEMNPEHDISDIEVYGLENFSTRGKYEKQGNFFNPIIATTITGSSRLLLSIIEKLLSNWGMTHAFCDTDSMAVPPEAVGRLQEFFRPLSPYDKGIELLKEEFRDVWFYGISAKRYVLYDLDGKDIKILKHSLHGLGHLLNPFGKNDDWHKSIWEAILNLHYGWISEDEFTARYSNFFGIAKLSITSQGLWSRIKNYNKGKSYYEKIKPFGFIIVGFGMKTKDKMVIKPIAPYQTNPQEVVHSPFIDHTTGRKFQGIEYWKPLSEILLSYINHPESKLEGDIGILTKKSVHITDVQYIGKEASNIQYTGTLAKIENNVYGSKEKLRERLLKITVAEARKLKISKTTLFCIKERINKGKEIKLRRKTIQRLSSSLV